MHDPNRFAEQDAMERIYAPESLPAGSPEQARVRADNDASLVDTNTPPVAAPVANLGNAPSAAMAPAQPRPGESARSARRAQPAGPRPDRHELTGLSRAATNGVTNTRIGAWSATPLQRDGPRSYRPSRPQAP